MLEGRWLIAAGYLGRQLVATAALLLLFALPVDAAEALKGVALVVGQSDYGTIADLPNTERDAEAVDKLLGDLGFNATVAINRDAKRLRRDLSGFLDDAEGADVAVFYYAGHAVEVGGENFLVPTDADAASPEALAHSLVSLNDFVERLSQKAKVTIVLLDACRNNPFPAGTTVQPELGASAVPVGAQGLQSRSVVALNPRGGKTDNGLGTVIAFAAEPGKVALDGPAGGNSPYAAALLRHLSAMSGEEFGTVMRLVAEEVYLKTDGRQRPWVNESLRRLLYFGRKAQQPTGDEGEILTERRRLLLTIADLPVPKREQVETVAAESRVPMDALYGILNALGARAPDDPADLETLLRHKSADLKKFIEERKDSIEPDPTIARLNALGDQAELEGALDAADALRERAKARVRDLRPAREAQEDALRQRTLEDAAVFARSAQTKGLREDFDAAAADYAEAFRLVERWDDEVAWSYKFLQGVSLAPYLNISEEDDAQLRSLVQLDQALALARQIGNHRLIGITQDWRGRLLFLLAGRNDAIDRYRASIAALQEAIASQPEADPAENADMLAQLGRTLHWLGTRLYDVRLLADSTRSYAAARDAYDAAANREKAAEIARSLSVVESHIDYDFGQFRLGTPDEQQPQGDSAEEATGRLERYVIESRRSLAGQQQSRDPVKWAWAQCRLGKSLRLLGEATKDRARIEEAVVSLRSVLNEHSADKDAAALAHSELGQALFALGFEAKSPTMLAEARENIDTAQKAFRGAGNLRYDAYLSAIIESYDMTIAMMSMFEK